MTGTSNVSVQMAQSKVRLYSPPWRFVFRESPSLVFFARGIAAEVDEEDVVIATGDVGADEALIASVNPIGMFPPASASPSRSTGW